MGAELFYTDGQTDRHDEANSRFSGILPKASTKRGILFPLVTE